MEFQNFTKNNDSVFRRKKTKTLTTIDVLHVIILKNIYKYNNKVKIKIKHIN